MLLNIDIDALRNRESELESELKQIREMLNLVNKYTVPTVALTPTTTSESKEQTSNNHHRKEGYKQVKGQRRNVLLILHTGAFSFNELMNALLILNI